MTAADLAQHHRDLTTLDRLRAELRQGCPCSATFSGPRGVARLEIFGAKAARSAGNRAPNAMANAQGPTLRFWVPEHQDAPLLEAPANLDLEAGLIALEANARAHLFEHEIAWFAAVLGVVRESVSSSPKPRVPKVGGAVMTKGRPSARAWASCLTLADLETAVLKAVA